LRIDDIAARLDQRFRLLTGRCQSAVRRYQRPKGPGSREASQSRSVECRFNSPRPT
jgi:hypothetical protein